MPSNRQYRRAEAAKAKKRLEGYVRHQGCNRFQIKPAPEARAGPCPSAMLKKDQKIEAPTEVTIVQASAPWLDKALSKAMNAITEARNGYVL